MLYVYLKISCRLSVVQKQCKCSFIRITCLCNKYPRKPHFYIVKLGFAGVYLFFLFLIQNIYCGYSLEPPHRGGSEVVLTCTHKVCFELKYLKYQNFSTENYQFLQLGKKSVYNMGRFL